MGRLNIIDSAFLMASGFDGTALAGSWNMPDSMFLVTGPKKKVRDQTACCCRL